jgi:hypothetical protein
MSRLQPLKAFIQFSQFISARPQRQSSWSGRLSAGRTIGNSVPFYALARNHLFYIPFESRAIPRNLLKNNGLMVCASGRLHEICLRGRHACRCHKRRSVPAVTASGRSRVVCRAIRVKHLTASLTGKTDQSPEFGHCWPSCLAHPATKWSNSIRQYRRHTGSNGP